MKTRVVLIALAVAFASSAPALAQLRGGTVEINPFAGYLFGGSFGRARTDFNEPFGLHLDVADDANYGGRIGYNFNSHFELEFEYAQTDTTFQIHSNRSFAPDQSLGDLKIQYFMGYATFNFGHGRAVPYFTVGGGAADLSPRFSGASSASDTRYTAAIGGGLKYFLNPHFGLRFDGRLYSTYLSTTDFYCGPYYVCTQSNWLTNGVLNGGLLVAF